MVTSAKKKLFLERLKDGDAPGCAAAAVDVARSTAYAWKKDDTEFSALWDDAVATYLDSMETEYVNLAKDDPENVAVRARIIEYTLSHRRRDQWGERDDNQAPATQNNYFLDVTMQERLERLDRLGLPRPVFESDREEDYAPQTNDDP